MTALELLQFQLQLGTKQLRACIDGLTDQQAEVKCSPAGMNSKEILEHLCETYTAVLSANAGGKHEWGTYKIEDMSIENVRATFEDLRAQAVSSCLSSDSPDMIERATDFLVAHDFYHVGQLVLARIQADPSWNDYSIYS